jgi:hypothetical protein
MESIWPGPAIPNLGYGQPQPNSALLQIYNKSFLFAGRAFNSPMVLSLNINSNNSAN